MDGNFLGTPDIGPWLFAALCVASFFSTYFSIVTGAAGGLMLLVIMASFVPATVLVPVHTVIQLGMGFSRAFAMWQHVLKGTIVPFTIGCALGALLGAKLFVALPTGALMGSLALFILIITWVPKFGQFGPERGRFAFLGFFVTLLGVFVSATGTLVGAFVAAASPDRRNHVGTMAALMATTHIAKMLAFLWVGLAIGAWLPFCAAMIVAGMLGNWVGEHSLNRMREEWFRMAFKIVMTVLAARLLWVAARDYGLV